MKKGKIFKTLAIAGICLCAPLLLSGCMKENESKIKFRVEDGYIQVTEDETTWKNLIDIDDLRGAPGQPGQNGVGIDGKQVEFNISATHIQWRYVGDNTWKDLIELEEIKGEPGDNGNDADIWTIGDDGYWYKNGIKTDHKAVGEDGEDGKNGSNGQNYVEQDVTLTLDYNLPQTLSKFDISNEVKYPTSVKLNRRWYVYSSGNPSYYFSLPDFANTAVEPFFKGWFTGVGVNERQIYNKEYLPTDTKVYAIWDTEEIYRQIELMNQFDKYSLTGNSCIIESLQDENLTNCEIPTIFINDTGVYSVCIKNGCFDNATSLEKIILGNEKFADSQGLVYNDIYTQVFKNCTKLEEVIISDNIRYIQAGLFDGCENLSKVQLSSQTRSIGYKAFANCTSLRNIYLPESTLYINESAFKGTSISEVYLPSRLQTLGAMAFAECKNLTKITIPSKITILQDGLFDGCSNLEEVVLSNVKTLDSFVFRGCEKLSILDTSNITTMKDFIFGSCSSLTQFIIGGADNVSFDKNSFETSGFSSLTLIVDNELVANNFIENSSYGYVLALVPCNTVYIDSDFDVSNSTYLLTNFTKQENSDKSGYDMYIKNS